VMLRSRLDCVLTREDSCTNDNVRSVVSSSIITKHKQRNVNDLPVAKSCRVVLLFFCDKGKEKERKWIYIAPLL